MDGNFTRKARLIAGCHKTVAPVSITYSSVVSRFYGTKKEEEIPPNMPAPRGNSVDVDHAGNVVNSRRPYTGILVFVNNLSSLGFRSVKTQWSVPLLGVRFCDYTFQGRSLKRSGIS